MKYHLHMMLRQIPNALTLTRLLFIIPFLMFFYHQEYKYAFCIFMLAGFTDGFDGWLARYFHWQSSFGTFVDPIADKLLITSSFIALALIGNLPWWLVILVFLRDLTISMGVIAWFSFIQHKPDLKPTYLSKINTVAQLLLVTVSLFEQAYISFGPHLQNTLIFFTTLTTSISYFDYVWTWGKKACLCLEWAK